MKLYFVTLTTLSKTYNINTASTLMQVRKKKKEVFRFASND